MLTFGLSKRFPSFVLDVELATASHRLVLFGPSGSGKSLTLQCIAGLERPDRGYVKLGQRTLLERDQGIDLPPERRHIGYVPQNAPLFPHLDVAANISFGLRHLRVAERAIRVRALLGLMHLDGFESRRPEKLSGGEQQRVALARALAVEPELLLLDEPFSALDAPVRGLLRQQLLDFQRQLGFAWTLVTHDLEEAYSLADEIVVYEHGRVLQAGPRDEVLYRPRTVEVARLVGVRNILPVLEVDAKRVRVESSTHELVYSLESDARQVTSAGGRFWACIRQEDILVRPRGGAASDERGTRLTGVITEERQLGFSISLRFAASPSCNPFDVWVEVPVRAYRSAGMAHDTEWELFIPGKAVHLIPRLVTST